MKTYPKNSINSIYSFLFVEFILGFFIIITCGGFAFTQIEVDGQYWKYNGHRVLLLGAWNHGHNPFIDHDTDNDRDKSGVSSEKQIKQAMDEMATAGGNYLRCVLNPGMASSIQGFAFCARNADGYDLNSMTGAFWERLEMFISEAKKRDIIVQIEVWDRFDFDRWQLGILAEKPVESKEQCELLFNIIRA